MPSIMLHASNMIVTKRALVLKDRAGEGRGDKQTGQHLAVPEECKDPHIQVRLSLWSWEG